MDLEHLRKLAERGWRFTRDGSTATALFLWEDPEDPDSGWEFQILKTEGHRPRFTLDPTESGLTERSAGDLETLADTIADAGALLLHWQGELLDEDEL